MVKIVKEESLANQGNNNSSRTRVYQNISQNHREQVVRLCLVEKQSLQMVQSKFLSFLLQTYDFQSRPIFIYQVSQQLGLKYCTCRTILKQYQKEGRIGKKKIRDKVLLSQCDIQLSLKDPLTGELKSFSYIPGRTKKNLVQDIALNSQENVRIIEQNNESVNNTLQSLITRLSQLIPQNQLQNLLQRQICQAITHSQRIANVQMKSQMTKHENQGFLNQEWRQQMMMNSYPLNFNLFHPMMLMPSYFGAQYNSGIIKTAPRSLLLQKDY